MAKVEKHPGEYFRYLDDEDEEDYDLPQYHFVDGQLQVTYISKSALISTRQSLRRMGLDEFKRPISNNGMSMLEAIEKVREIHNNVDFLAELTVDKDSELERIEAKLTELKSRKDFDRIERRKNLGFALTREQEDQNEVLQKEKAEVEKEIAETTKERDVYLLLKEIRAKYHTRKFVLMSELRKMCKTHNLALGYTFHYIGELPDKNMEDLENYQPLPEAVGIYEVKLFEKWTNGRSRVQNSVVRISDEDLAKYVRETIAENDASYTAHVETKKREGFVIVCPPSDLTQTIDQITVKVETPDPIVLAPVVNSEILEVITKWGPEALDETVQNPALN